MGIGKEFKIECVDIVERAMAGNIEIIKISIEGIYKDEIFEFSYIPKEEG